MPDLQVRRRPVRTSDHSLLVSLVVSGLLVLGYGIGLKVYGAMSMADAVAENGETVTVQKVYRDEKGVAVDLGDGDIDDLNYVSDPADYVTPFDVLVYDQLDQRPGRQDRLVVAVQDLDHLRSESHRRWVMIGFGALLVLFVGSAVFLNRPRRRPVD